MRIVIFLALLAGSHSPASAHAFAQRYDLPLPLWHYIVGAGATVGLSFVLAARIMRRDIPVPPGWRIGIREEIAGLFETLVRLIGFAFLILLLAAGFLGEQGDWDSNLLPVGVWVIWWVGLTFVCALLGNIWPLLDPWRSVGLRLFRHRVPPDCTLPGKLGAWPAVLLFLAFSWAELVWSENAVPRKLATLVVAWSLVSWIGMATVGVEAWRKHCDPFGIFFGLIGRFAPLAAERTAHGAALVIRPFGSGLQTSEPPTLSDMAFVLLVLSTVAFDGVSETPFWESVVGLAIGALYTSGFVGAFGYGVAGAVIKTTGLVLAPLVFFAVYLAVSALAGKLSGERALDSARRNVLTLTPIAIAYHLAHYLSYLLIQGQAIIPLLSDPLNLGWNLFGTAGREIDIGMADARFIWLSAVAAIVTGHVVAILLAHREALRTASAREAILQQWPMTALMIAYTMLSLWILSQPIVEIS